MKICKTCKAEKPKTEFYAHKLLSDGLANECKTCAKARTAKWVSENKERHAQNCKAYATANPGKKVEALDRWAAKNPGRSVEIKKAWKKRNPESGRSYIKRRVANDDLFRLKVDMRRRLWSVLSGRGWKKLRSSEEIFGCTYEFLKDYLTSKFKEGMNWENRSEWHIDHIVPLASAKTREEMLALAHYTNLQPLWAAENWEKGGRMSEELKAC